MSLDNYDVEKLSLVEDMFKKALNEAQKKNTRNAEDYLERAELAAQSYGYEFSDSEVERTHKIMEVANFNGVEYMLECASLAKTNGRDSALHLYLKEADGFEWKYFQLLRKRIPRGENLSSEELKTRDGINQKLKEDKIYFDKWKEQIKRG